VPAAAGSAEEAAVAPDFGLKALDGRNHRLSELRGQVVLVNFWTSRCGPCRAQVEALQALHEELAEQGLRVLSVNFDSDPQRAREFVDGSGIGFPVLLDAGREVSRLYGVRGIPHLVSIDRDGRLRHVHDDYRAGRARLYREQVAALLEE
jgi:peroxiredoxin